MSTLLSAVLALTATARILTLDEAVQTARANQPQLREAHASTDAARALADEARAPLLPQLALTVRATFFGARANKALASVAEETVANLQRHLEQTQAFVKAGTRPDIDLFQARSDLATAQVQLINARNNYSQSRAQLNQAMGVEGSIDYDVADQSLGPTPGEDAPTDQLLVEA